MKAIPTQKAVRELFEYHEDGYLTWKKRTANCIKVGCIAGTRVKKDNYSTIKVNGLLFYLHKIIYLWHTGKYPEFLDHIDRDRSNDKIKNLRESSRRQNNCNRNSAKGSSSKYLGVHLRKGRGVYQASIRVNREAIYLGNFKNELNAAMAYNRAAVKYHGEYANLNIVQP